MYEAEARRVSVPPFAYIRALVIVNLKQRGGNTAVRRSVLHTNFDRAIKRFMLTYQMSVGVAGLTAKEKRDELEELSWGDLGGDQIRKSSAGPRASSGRHARHRIPDED